MVGNRHRHGSHLFDPPFSGSFDTISEKPSHQFSHLRPIHFVFRPFRKLLMCCGPLQISILRLVALIRGGFGLCHLRLVHIDIYEHSLLPNGSFSFLFGCFYMFFDIFGY